jgi:hypothetical protein
MFKTTIGEKTVSAPVLEYRICPEAPDSNIELLRREDLFRYSENTSNTNPNQQ